MQQAQKKGFDQEEKHCCTTPCLSDGGFPGKPSVWLF